MILVIQGPKGSAKSTTTELIKDLIDPAGMPTRALPRSEQDLMIAAQNSWVLALDNISEIPKWLSDSLCRLSTGGGLSTRTLYSDKEEQLFHSKRPMILNGINNIIERPDLIDRAVFVFFPNISQTERKAQRDIKKEFEDVKPLILGGIFKAISTALANHNHIHLEKKPRMADAAIWVSAAEAALPWRKGKFLEYFNNMIVKTTKKLSDDDVLIRTCGRLLKRKKAWKGKPSNLLSKLVEIADPEEASNLPKSASHLTRMLKERSWHLKHRGLQVNTGRKPGYRWIEIQKRKMTT